MGAFDYKEKQRKVSGLLNGGASTLVYASTGAAANCASVSVGTLSAGVLKKVLSISGKGQINFLMALENNGAGPYNNQIKVTLDGTVIFDKTVSISQNYGVIAVGYGAGAGTAEFLAMHQPIQFESSLLVEIASSSESSYQTLYYNAETHV